jgi:hypothetical protein
MRVNNPDRSPLGIKSRDPAQIPAAFLEIAGDDFLLLQRRAFVTDVG